MYCRILTALLVIFSVTLSMATHYRAGEIIYEQIDDTQFEVTVITYTRFLPGQSSNEAPNNADQDEILISWGDGDSTLVSRSVEQQLTADIKLNQYTARHTYNNGAGAIFRVSINDPNRVDEILNINNGITDLIPFYLETTIYIRDPLFLGFNTSPVLLQPPIDRGFIGADFIHNPNAFDIDGDSLTYELVAPLDSDGSVVPGFVLPSAISAGPDNEIIFDEVTGDFLWSTPQQEGIYNIAILIREYRNGRLLSEIIRDIQITIENAVNNPPTVELINDTCIIAGDSLNFSVFADDPDTGDNVLLSATGGPLVFADQPATFDVPTTFQPPIVEGVFDWKTTCEDVRQNDYQIVFRAVDDFDNQGLATLERLTISVVAPPPVIDTVLPTIAGNRVTWDADYPCIDASKFAGFNVYRRVGSMDIQLDTCAPGLQGYELIARGVGEQQDGQFFYVDDDIEPNTIYCYRILAQFTENFIDAIPFESLTSEEVCILAGQDAPFITQVDVMETSSTLGEIGIAWTKPRLPDLDTITFQAPYVLELTRTVGGISEVIFTDRYESFLEIINTNDTVFTDTNLNTEANQYAYQVSYIPEGEDPLASATAQSIFASTSSSNESVTVDFQVQVPWTNDTFEILRALDLSGPFMVIDTIESIESFVDTGLENDVEYCYLIQSRGGYGTDDLPSPLINRSQIVCDTPIDNEPPCTPVGGESGGSFTLVNVCDVENDIFSNQLNWTLDVASATCLDEVSTIRLYFTADGNLGNAQLLEEVSGTSSGTFTHVPSTPAEIIGCYYLTSVDAAGNESEPSALICGESCPTYRLPDVFTPNTDGANDLYTPFPYSFVTRIDLRVFNQWGNLVFTSTDPDIEWDGTGLNGNRVADGVYHYHCKVYFLTSEGEVERDSELTGFIHVLSGQDN